MTYNMELVVGIRFRSRIRIPDLNPDTNPGSGSRSKNNGRKKLAIYEYLSVCPLFRIGSPSHRLPQLVYIPPEQKEGRSFRSLRIRSGSGSATLVAMRFNGEICFDPELVQMLFNTGGLSMVNARLLATRTWQQLNRDRRKITI